MQGATTLLYSGSTAVSGKMPVCARGIQRVPFLQMISSMAQPPTVAQGLTAHQEERRDCCGDGGGRQRQ
jgi:hypothetical protein